MRGQHDAQDVVAEHGRQHDVLLDAAPRLEEKKLMAGDAGLRQAAQLFHAAVEFLIERIAQERLGVLLVAVARGGNRRDRDLGVERRRSAELQQLNAAVARSGLGHRAELRLGREFEAEIEVLVGVAGWGKVGLLGIGFVLRVFGSGGRGRSACRRLGCGRCSRGVLSAERQGAAEKNREKCRKKFCRISHRQLLGSIVRRNGVGVKPYPG